MSTPKLLSDAIEGLLARDKQVKLVAVGVREIYRAGDSAEFLYFVRSGMVKLCHAGGGLVVVVAGELFGEELLWGEEIYGADATRIMKGEILRIPVAWFERVARRHSELWQGVAMLIRKQLVRERRSFQQLAHLSTDERIVAMLAHLAPSCPLVPSLNSDRLVHSIPLTQAELALLVGASRETTSSELNAMARRGELELRRGRLLVPARSAKSAAKSAAKAAHAG